jgi:hypothetical protein
LEKNQDKMKQAIIAWQMAPVMIWSPLLKILDREANNE